MVLAVDEYFGIMVVTVVVLVFTAEGINVYGSLKRMNGRCSWLVQLKCGGGVGGKENLGNMAVTVVVLVLG